MKIGLKSFLAVMVVGAWGLIFSLGMSLIEPIYGMWGVAVYAIFYTAITIGVLMAAIDRWADKK